MAYSEQERDELVRRISDAFRSVFTEEESTRTPEFEREMKEFFGLIDADWTKIDELESSSNASDRLMVDLLRGRIHVRWKELFAAIDERGSLSDRKYVQFMALLFPVFGIDFPFSLNPDAKLLMELLSRPSTPN